MCSFIGQYSIGDILCSLILLKPLLTIEDIIMAGDGKKDPNATADSKRQRKYNGKPAQKKRRAARNTARRKAVKRGVKLEGKDLDHADGNPLNGKPSNVRPMSKKKNRSRNNNK